ncbi:hypothetical protein DVH24_042350 [Malus domestica]|uniref:Uncharacterized protein n=1 Tax=Malus domestica TaxID=3750 RepID=A0A498IXV6_MALDO|nr:hypothetical protein DVH24_042350 [Malus domestica]
MALKSKISIQANAQFPANVPHKVNKHFFFTIGLGTNPCSNNNQTFRGSKGAFGTWDGTGRGVPSRVWCAKNGWNGLFHGTDFGCFCVPPPPWNGFVPRLWNTMFYHFKTNIPHVFFKNYTFVPSRLRTKRTQWNNVCSFIIYERGEEEEVRIVSYCKQLTRRNKRRLSITAN